MKKLVECQMELYAFIGALMPDCASDVEDVVQDTNAEVISCAADYDPTRPFRPWLWAFARNQVKAYFLKRSRCPIIFDDELARTAAETFPSIFPEEDGRASLLRRLELCKRHLPPKYLDLLDRRYKARESVEQIAAEKQSNAHTVTTTLAYIRKKLGDCIRRFCRLDNAPEDPENELSEGMKELSGCLERKNEWTPDISMRFRDLLRSPDLLRFWLEQNGIHALLTWEAKAFPAFQQAAAPRARFLRRTATIAAGLALLACAFAARKGLNKVPRTRQMARSAELTAQGKERKAGGAVRRAEGTEQIVRTAERKPQNEGQKEAKDLSPADAGELVKGEAMHVQTVFTETSAVMKVAIVAMAVSTARASTLATLYMNAPRYWQTAYTNEIPICWDWGPAAATKAVFSLEGMYTATTTTLSRAAGNVTCFLPESANEDLYTLRLTYTDDAGNPLGALTGRVASVCGVSRTEEGVFLPEMDMSNTATNLAKVEAWPRVRRPGAKDDNVVIAYDAAWITNAATTAVSLTVAKQNATKSQTTALESPGGWTAWQPLKDKWGNGWFSFALTVNGEALSAPVYRPSQGFVLYLK